MNKEKDKKALLREEYLRKRRYFEEEKRQSKNKVITQRLSKLSQWTNATNALIYISTKYEVATIPLIKEFLDQKNIIVPKTHLRFETITLHRIKSFDDLYKGNHDILEPYPETEIVKPEEIDIAIIPGIVFDHSGHRIGYGKGYYDKLLKIIKCEKIGLAYEAQVVKNIPAEKHDIKIDMLITENKKYLFTT